MAFREVRVFEVREVLRLWLAGEGIRATERLVGFDRKTVRRYVDAAVGLGLVRDGGDVQLSDVFIGQVVEAVRPHRTDGHGAPWRLLQAHHDEIAGWVGEDLTAVKIHELLERRGVSVPCRTVQRYVAEVLGRTRGRGPTVRVNDGEPGDELQVDFGRMGLIFDPASGRDRVVHALIFTAVFSRHCFVWLTHRQTTEAVIAGCEAAWAFFGGVFATLIPDNMSSIVEGADPLEPRLNQCFVEYAQARGFLIDPARVRSPQDKPRVERQVQFVRGSFFAGECFIDLPDAQRRAEAWCRERAGLRIHGTTQQRPAEVFAAEEQSRLLRAPTAVYDVPIYATAKVHRDHHIEVARSLYSIPGALIGARVEVRADRTLVRIFHRGQLIKVHPRQEPGRRSTIPKTCRRTRPSTRCAISTPCNGWLPSTAQPSAPTRQRCSTSRCPGPRCARSTPCWGSSRSGVRPGSKPRARAPSNTRPSTSGSSAACSNAAPSTRPSSRRCLPP